MPAKRTLDHSTSDARKAARTRPERKSASPNSEHQITDAYQSQVCHIFGRRPSAACGPALIALRWRWQQALCPSTAANCDYATCMSVCGLFFPHLIMQIERAGIYPAVWRVRTRGPKPWSRADKVCARNKLHVSYQHES